MSPILQSSLAANPGAAAAAFDLAIPAAGPERSSAIELLDCFHCGEACPDPTLRKGNKAFCCQGCLAVHDILAESGLDHFYDLAQKPGIRAAAASNRERWAFLDVPAVQQQLLDFTDGKQSCVTLRIPAIHCVACVWLLENLFRLHDGIGESKVHFPRREVCVRFSPEKISLGQLAAVLASIGYEPQFTLGEAKARASDPAAAKRWLKLGIAGFAFGNIMLFSIPAYLGLDSFSGPAFRILFRYLSLALAFPVLVYSASDYWRGALVSARQRVLTLDVPIALGLAALYLQSAVEIISSRGDGYLDSLAGLVFFLLCGRAFQRKTFDRINFDLDYQSFFPLAATRKTAQGEHSAAISDLRPGDRLVIRNGELIPADATLVKGDALVDYSFVTGESEPVVKAAGDHLYAGGKQAGASIEVLLVKAVSQSYLASLWDHQAFAKERTDHLNTLTNVYSRRFTRLVIAIALGAGLFWTFSNNPARAAKAFASVLIVACPCALALAAPFALGTAQRLLARLQIFLKNALILERLARVDTIVFDKTGTLTSARSDEASFQPFGDELTSEERQYVHSLSAQSIHPHSLRIRKSLSCPNNDAPVTCFREIPGCGIEGMINGHHLRLGSEAWVRSTGVDLGERSPNPGSASYFLLDGRWRGTFSFTNPLRPKAKELVQTLAARYRLALLSGDNPRELETFKNLLGANAELLFNQSPLQKLEFIKGLQRNGRTVMMVGDGLNDAGALKQSDVGVAVVEQLGIFSPASDVILETGSAVELPKLLAFARKATAIVRCSFLISALYNAVGISIAAAGILSPLICAVLMPLSSVSVVLFACGAARWASQKAGFTGKDFEKCSS